MPPLPPTKKGAAAFPASMPKLPMMAPANKKVTEKEVQDNTTTATISGKEHGQQNSQAGSMQQVK